ncbi:hypothetical protein WMY93_002658 [Mugilogobius chulae]|uniref:Deleted in malignant brain tumors 1 protein-like n=1 Tax=Mugilogobius chulae TaxID=88201 RepID=A0AAW0PXR9_9GOBI
MVVIVVFLLVCLLRKRHSRPDDQIRLAGSGSSGCSGRVEVYHKSSWGTVCDDEWDMSDAQVVCRQMGCGPALGATGGAGFGEGSGKIWLDDVKCSGNESFLTQCGHRGFGTNNCGHGEDAGVICSVILPKPSFSVTPAFKVMWGQNVRFTCSINTEHSEGTFFLKFSTQNIQTSNSNPATFSLPLVTFDIEGPYYCLYEKVLSGQTFTSPQSDSLKLLVNVVLPVPSLCVSSPADAKCSSDTVYVTRGDSFVVRCSVPSDVPEGLFLLWFSGSNSLVSDPSVNHSASFSFPLSQSQHQGQYSCVYQVTGAGRTYTSNTTLDLIIKCECDDDDETMMMDDDDVMMTKRRPMLT